MSTDTPLRTSWNVYEHPAGVKDWSLSSYKKIASVKTMTEAAALLKGLVVDHDRITGSYLCLMRDGIEPIYESDENKEGGALTIRFGPDISKSFWLMFAAHAMCDEILSPVSDIDPDFIHGIIISPKRGNIIIQIWTQGKLSPEQLNPVVRITVPGDILYRPHYERV